MRMSNDINDLATALAAAQAEIKDANKSATNPHFRRTYATLGDVWDAIREPFAKNGLSVTQLTSVSNHGLVLNTVLMHKSGQYMQGEYPIVPTKNDPQGAGSALTYARRYALASAAGVAPQDESEDDGNAASAPPAAKSLGSFGARQAAPAPDITKTAPAPVEAPKPVKAASWTLPWKTPADFAKVFKEKLMKAPDIASYEKLFTDNNDNILRLLDENQKQHDTLMTISNGVKLSLINKKETENG